jgi:hypothetical protein
MDSTSHKSLLQFSLRRSFWALTSTAILLALIAPAFRSLSPEQQAIVFRLGGVFLATMLVLVSSIFGLRYRAERRCGDIILIVPPPQPVKPPKWLKVLIPLMMFSVVIVQLVISFLSLSITLRQPQGTLSTGSSWLPYFIAFTAAFQLTMVIPHIWLRNRFLTTELGKNGMIRGGLLFVPWSSFTSYSWNASKTAVDMRTRFSRTPVPVSSDHFEQVDSILQQHFPAPALQ